MTPWCPRTNWRYVTRVRRSADVLRWLTVRPKAGWVDAAARTRVHRQVIIRRKVRRVAGAVRA